MAEEIHVHQQQPPAGGNGGGGGAAWIMALLVVIVLAVVLWFVFARGGPDRGVPDEVDVDVNVPTTTGR
jgi:hypothetical protein